MFVSLNSKVMLLNHKFIIRSMYTNPSMRVTWNGRF